MRGKTWRFVDSHHTDWQSFFVEFKVAIAFFARPFGLDHDFRSVSMDHLH